MNFPLFHGLFYWRYFGLVVGFWCYFEMFFIRFGVFFFVALTSLCDSIFLWNEFFFGGNNIISFHRI